MAVSVRMDPLLERELELAAKRKGMTKSQFIIDAVERSLGRKDPAVLYHKVMEEAAQYKIGGGAQSEDLSAHKGALRKSLQEVHALQQEEYAAYLAAQAKLRETRS